MVNELINTYVQTCIHLANTIIIMTANNFAVNIDKKIHTP